MEHRDYTLENRTDQNIIVTWSRFDDKHSATLASNNSTSMSSYGALSKICATDADQNTVCVTAQFLNIGGPLHAHKNEDGALTITRGKGPIQFLNKTESYRYWNGTESEYISDLARRGNLRGTGEKH